MPWLFPFMLHMMVGMSCDGSTFEEYLSDVRVRTLEFQRRECHAMSLLLKKTYRLSGCGLRGAHIVSHDVVLQRSDSGNLQSATRHGAKKKLF